MKKPRLSFWQIWNMSFGFLGIQFGFALQNANVSRIFETLGADVSQIPILWIAAPVTGLIVQPIIGYLSDNTWNRFGRRRPFFMIGAVLASLALFVMPNSPYLWIAAGMLWIMDASINIAMEPFRAFVGDMLPSEQRTKGFAMQSFFIGIGAVVASALPWMMTNWFNISNTAAEGVIPDSVKFSFYAGGLIFFIAVMWTVYRTKEYTPEQLKAFEEYENQLHGIEEKIDEGNKDSISRAQGKKVHGPILLLLGILTTLLVTYQEWANELYILTVGVALVGLVIWLSGILQEKGSRNGMVVIFDDLYLMPKTMKQLAVVQFFSWFALFAMWIYTTAGVTSHIYDMKLSASEVAEMQQITAQIAQLSDEEITSRLARIQSDLSGFEEQILAGQANVTASMRVVNFFQDDRGLEISDGLKTTLARIEQQYNDGADWVGVAFAAYNGFAAIVAFLLPVIAGYTNRKTTHAISLIAGSIGLISIYFVTDPVWILVSMIGVGLAWASILSMPYAILAGSLPAKKMGTYMGIFNFFIVLPQILAASVLGFLVGGIFGGEAIYALVLGGVTWIGAAVLVMFVDDVDDPDVVDEQDVQMA